LNRHLNSFKGSYSGANNSSLFGGIGVDEIFLIRAECFARNGDITSTITDLNTILIKRWKTGTIVPFIAGTANTAGGRKKLCFRAGLRCAQWCPTFAGYQ